MFIVLAQAGKLITDQVKQATAFQAADHDEQPGEKDQYRPFQLAKQGFRVRAYQNNGQCHTNKSDVGGVQVEVVMNKKQHYDDRQGKQHLFQACRIGNRLAFIQRYRCPTVHVHCQHIPE